MKNVPQVVVDAMDATERRPSLLFLLHITDVVTLRYVAGISAVTFPTAGDVYSPKMIQMKNVKQAIGGQIGRLTLKFDNTLRDMSAYAEHYTLPGKTLEIWRVYRNQLGNASYYEPVFYGIMEQPKFDGNVMSIAATSGLSLVRRSPARIYATLCPYVFGDSNCNRSAIGTVTCVDTVNPTYQFYDLARESEAAYTGVATDVPAGSPKKEFSMSAFAGQPSDCWNTKRLTWLTGNNTGESKTVDAFDGEKGVFTLDGDCTNDIVEGDNFALDDLWKDVMLTWTGGSNSGESGLVTSFIPIGVETTKAVTAVVPAAPRTEFIDDTLIGDGDDYYNGYRLKWVPAAANTAEVKQIVDFTSADGTIEVESAFDDDIVIGDPYVMTPGPQIMCADDPFTNSIAVGDTYILANVDITRAPLKQTGSATSTTDTTTLIDTNRTEEEHFWLNGSLEVTSVTEGITEKRSIIAFDATADKVTVDFPFSFTVTTGDFYTILAGCDKTWESCRHRVPADIVSFLVNGDFETGDLSSWHPDYGWADRTGDLYDGDWWIDDDQKGLDDGYATGQFVGLGLTKLTPSYREWGAIDKFRCWHSPYYGYYGWYGLWRHNPHSGAYIIDMGGAVNNVSDNRYATYSVHIDYAQPPSNKGLGIITTGLQDVKVVQYVAKSVDMETQDMFQAEASIYIPAASTISSVRLRLSAAYVDEPDKTFKTLGEVFFSIATRDAWQTEALSNMLTHSGREIAYILFEIFAQQLYGTIHIDDCSLQTDIKPKGPVHDNTRNYGGFPTILRLGDTGGLIG